MPVPIPEGAQVGEPEQQGAAIPQGAQIGEPEQQGFLSTVGSDVGEFASGIGKSITHIAGHVFKAVDSVSRGDTKGAIDSLLEPPGEMIDAQLKSSSQAAQRMIEAGKQGDALGVAQHAAGIIPIASQVDAAMTKYQQEPSRENLAHVVTSAIPAFIPELMRGGGKLLGSTTKGVEAEAAQSVSKAGLEEGQAAQPAKTVRTPAREVELAPSTTETIPERTMTTSSEAPKPIDLAPSVRGTMNKVAAKEGLKPIPDTVDIRDVPKNLSDQFYFRSKAGFDAIKQATGIDLNVLKDKIYDLHRKIDSVFDDPEQEGRLIEKLNGLEDEANRGFEEAKSQGIDTRQPLEDWKKMKATSEYGTAVRSSAEGKAGTINPDKYAPKVEKMYRSTSPTQPGRLQQIMGEENASSLRDDAYAAQETQKAIKEYKPPADTKVPGATIKNPSLTVKSPASVTKTPAVAATESKALYELVRPNVKGNVLTGGSRTNWAKVQESFDKLKPEEASARFKNPTQVREVIHAQARNQLIKTIVKVGGIGAAASALGISSWLAHRLIE